MNSWRRWLAILPLSLALPTVLALADAAPTTAPATAPAPEAGPESSKVRISPTTAPVSAVPKAPRPTTAVALNTCANPGCHPEVKTHKNIHGPVNVNSCDACHTLADPAKHTFKLARDKDKLCTFCHVLELKDAKVVHKPMLTGECLACHDPHGGPEHSMVRGKNMSDLCKTCHQDVTANRKNVHGPVGAGACGACHAPHSSQNPKLLVITGRQLCLSCHQELAQQLKNVKVQHKPAVDGDCLSCHDSHASNNASILKAAPAELCTTACHQDIKKLATTSKVQHSVVTKDKACITCHTPHGSDLRNLLKDQPIKLCLACHNKEIKVGDQTTVPALDELADPSWSRHGPLRDGYCAQGCHNPHGSDQPRLLSKPYPAGFYESFQLEKYELCFNCHDKQLVLTKRTAGLTGFRNGEVNLHYLHVNKDQRGRTCRACHATHASAQPAHVRPSVPYGNWQLPINFKPTRTGGSCSPGCHQPLTYDRENPAAPTTAPVEAGPESSKVRISPAPAPAPGFPAAATGATIPTTTQPLTSPETKTP